MPGRIFRNSRSANAVRVYCLLWVIRVAPTGSKASLNVR
jgi:hypothetical protein